MNLSPTESAIQTVLVSFLQSILPAGVPVVEGQDNRVPEPSATDFVVFTPIRRERIETNIDITTDCAFTASIASSVMTVTGMQIGAIGIGNQLFGVGIPVGTIISGQLSGSAGGTGSYGVTTSGTLTIGPETMACGTLSVLQPVDITFQLDVHGPGSSDNAQIITTLWRDDYAVEFFNGSGVSAAPLYADDPRQIPFINAENQFEYRWVVEARLQANQSVTVGQQFAGQLQVSLINVETGGVTVVTAT